MAERHFDQELGELKASLLRMAGLVEKSIAEAVRALVERDDALAEKVIREDARIDEMEVAIEETCLRELALRQPIAVDLRFITSAIKINSDLERMADQAVNISESALELIKEPLLKPLVDIPRMSELAQSMVKESLDAFIHRDVALARKVCDRDDEMDHLRDQVFRELLTYMMQDPKTINRAVHLILVARNLERISDLATNVGEDVVYFVQGKVIRHGVHEWPAVTQ
ncbi:MAG: phosphate signaling complex protein PhoU [Candidatus Latescibacterota bacterium]